MYGVVHVMFWTPSYEMVERFLSLYDEHMLDSYWDLVPIIPVQLVLYTIFKQDISLHNGMWYMMNCLRLYLLLEKMRKSYLIFGLDCL